ncbi:MAG: hypothetical protein Tsb009_09140 [Planctomycetaceae bacterium]
MRSFHVIQTCLVLSLMAHSVHTLSADVIKLKNGGEVRGQITDETSPQQVVIQTLSGSIVAVKRDHIQFVTKRLLRYEEYERLARRTKNTFDAQWKLAEWCRERGMKAERETHLRNIIALNPDHLESRRALGYSKVNGEWSTHDERQRARGLVKYKNRYITPEELELIKKAEANSAQVREWSKKIKKYHGWLTHRLASKRKEGTRKLWEIRDPYAVVGLARYFRNDKNVRFREFYLKILANIPGLKPTGPLVWQALNDNNEAIRYAAVNALRKDQYPAAMGMFIAALRSPYNPTVLRAARGLARVGDERAISPLINALMTTHRYKVRVRDRSGTMSFGSNGTFGNNQNLLPPQIEAMMRAGLLPNGVIVNPPVGLNKPVRTKVITVSRNHQNAEVLAALRKITGQSFGYNQRDWRLWHAAVKSGNGTLTKSP